MPGMFNSWFMNAFTVPYNAAIGEYEYENFEESEYGRALTILFIVSTFLINIVFLNMLIAIMGDTHAKATQDQKRNARISILGKISDYVALLNKNSVKDVEGERNFLYVVKADIENIFDSTGEWEGQVTQIKKFTENKISQATEEMMSGIKQISDRAWDQEIKQTNQEREIKMTMQKISMENLKMN